MIEHFVKGRRVRVAGALDQVAVGCREDLAAVYRDYWDLVYKRCHATLEDHEAALDATQDVFLQALASFDDIRHDIVRGLLDMARTIAYERKRRPSREVPLAHPRPGHARNDDPAEIVERHRVLDDVWSGLSQVERRYLADKFAGFSFEEIARRNRRALGTVSSNLARAREHARRMREPMLPALLGLVGGHRVLGLGRRLRGAAGSPTLGVAMQPVQGFTVSLALVGLLGGTPAAAMALGGVQARPALVASAPGHDDAAGTATVADVPAAAGSTTARFGAAGSGAAAGARSTVASSLVGAAADSETPEDTSIVSATPSPDYAHDHTIVALGLGHSCRCMAVLRSSDGGATWEARQGPPAGDQVVLPPTYPTDPRIFVGFGNASGTATNYWTDGWGDAFAPLVPLPAGTLALPAGFGRGDNRVLVSTPQGVFAEDMTTRVVQTLLTNPLGGVQPSLVSPGDDIRTSILAVTSSRAFSPAAPEEAATAAQGTTLWSCPPGLGCHSLDTLPDVGGAKVVVSPAFSRDGTVGVYTDSAYLLSHDGGASFASVAAPSSVGTNLRHFGSSAVASSRSIWLTAVTATQAWALFLSGDDGASWREVDGANSAITAAGGHVVVLDPQRVLFLPAHGGLLCTVNSGASWSTRCPTA